MYVGNARCTADRLVFLVDFTERSIGSFCTSRLNGTVLLSDDGDFDSMGILDDCISSCEVSKNADKWCALRLDANKYGGKALCSECAFVDAVIAFGLMNDASINLRM